MEINPLSVASLATLFSYFVGCLFVLFRVSFAVQKFLSLIRSHLFIFVVIVITLRGGSEKMLLSFMSESVWPMFPSKSFILSGLISRSLIHFEISWWVWLRIYQFCWSFQRTSFSFHWSFLWFSSFLFHWFLLWSLWLLFLLLTLGFVCSFFSCFRCKVRLFIWVFSCFLR